MSLAIAFESIPALLTTFVGMSIGYVVASLLGAIWLRLAAAWARIPLPDFGRSLIASLTANFVLLSFGSTVGLQLWGVLGKRGRFSQGEIGLADLFNAYTLAFLATFLTAVHAVVFTQTLTDAEGQPLRTGKSIYLSLLYLATSNLFWIVATFGVLAVLSAFVD